MTSFACPRHATMTPDFPPSQSPFDVSNVHLMSLESSSYVSRRIRFGLVPPGRGRGSQASALSITSGLCPHWAALCRTRLDNLLQIKGK